MKRIISIVSLIVFAIGLAYLVFSCENVLNDSDSLGSVMHELKNRDAKDVDSMRKLNNTLVEDRIVTLTNLIKTNRELESNIRILNAQISFEMNRLKALDKQINDRIKVDYENRMEELHNQPYEGYTYSIVKPLSICRDSIRSISNFK